MHRVEPAGRGPSPWRGPRAPGPRVWPRTRVEWPLFAARVQLAAILFYSVILAMAGWMVYFADFSALECFDGDEPACTEPEPPFPLARFLVQSAAWALVIAAGVFAVWKRTLVTLIAPAVAALAANRLAEIPLPF
jgi:hypothetical protein